MSKDKQPRLGSDEPQHHKLEQLNKQVEMAVTTALACSADHTLRELECEGVTPIHGGSCFRVTVRMTMDSMESPDQVLERLKRARGYLRSEIADSIHRKRTPELVFTVAASDDHPRGALEKE